MITSTIAKTLVALLPMAPMTSDALIHENAFQEISNSQYSDYEGPTLEELASQHNSNVPTIEGVEHVNVKVGDDFDEMRGVYALDNRSGNITDQIEITDGDVNTSEPGVYYLTYRVENNAGGWYEVVRQVTVSDQPSTEIEPTPPTERELHGETASNQNTSNIRFIGTEDVTISTGDDFDPLEGIEVVDENGDFITDKVHVTGEVDTNSPGEYTIGYSVFDSDGEPQAVARTITVE